MTADIRGASNAKAGRELAWNAAHPSWREGFRGIDERLDDGQAHRLAVTEVWLVTVSITSGTAEACSSSSRWSAATSMFPLKGLRSPAGTLRYGQVHGLRAGEFDIGAGAGFPGMGTAVRLTHKCAAGRDSGLAAHGWCYLVAPSSGLIASYSLSANFRWELSSSSAKW